MFGKSNTQYDATVEARLEAIELTLLAVLPALPSQTRAVVKEHMVRYVERAVAKGPPSSLVPSRHAQHFRDMLNERIEQMIDLMD